MFTGIVTDVGCVRAVDGLGEGGLRLTIETGYETETVALGASISCSGVCLTVVDKGPDWFVVDASNETLARTTLGNWTAGSRVNLERALRLGDEMGGHIVSGHVDGVAAVVSIAPDGTSCRYVFQVHTGLAKYIAEKGSVAIDGVSLTVNGVTADRFDTNVIPFTQEHTTLGTLTEGQPVNVEIDMLARYVARLREQS
ncbi:MAG: riboflavin synthase [Alphaproteobacteria bacterium]|nr:riboflavin synthase [Alphaproteobacteria bacterium]